MICYEVILGLLSYDSLSLLITVQRTAFGKIYSDTNVILASVLVETFVQMSINAEFVDLLEAGTICASSKDESMRLV